MPLQNFVDNSLPTIKAAWLNAVDAFYFTLFNSATTASQARTALGSTTVGDAVFIAASAAAGRTALGLGTMAVEAATDYVTKATLTTTGDSFVASAASTPARLAALASVAAHATTMNLWAARENVLTGGIVTVTDIADAPYAGAVTWVKMNDAHIWDDGAVFDVQGGADYTAAAGDWIRIYATTTSTFEITIFKASGVATATPVFSLSYSSGNQTVSNAGLLTLAHGLGVAPKIVQFFAVCLTGEYNWTAGAIIPLAGVGNTFSGAGGVAVGFAANVVDATNITVRFGAQANPLVAIDATTGALQSLTSASWALLVRAYA